MKEDRVAKLVGDLTEVARAYGQMQQTRERIARLIVPVIIQLNQKVRDLEAKLSDHEAHCAKLLAANPWKQAVIDELVTCHILNQAHESAPRQALKDAIAWNVDIALCPDISLPAAQLKTNGQRELLLQLIAKAPTPEVSKWLTQVEESLADTQDAPLPPNQEAP
jgi:hypothetical protein